jgi:hypothetical protein
LSLEVLIDISPPLLLSTKRCGGGLLEASLVVVLFAFLFFIIIMSVSQRRGIKRRWVRGGCDGHATVVKTETTKACFSIPLLHRSLILKSSNSFFKGLNLNDFFTLGCNVRTRRLQVQVSAYFFH